jgi:hypothetical protein
MTALRQIYYEIPVMWVFTKVFPSFGGKRVSASSI